MNRCIIFIWFICITSFALASTKDMSNYQRISLDHGFICVKKDLPVKVRHIAGLFGTDIGGSRQGVSVFYPITQGERAIDRVDNLGIFVKPAIGVLASLPVMDDARAVPLEEVPGLVEITKDVAPLSDQLVAGPDIQALLGRFVAVCDGMPTVQVCSRPFRFDGLTGSYSFKRGDLFHWREMEAALEKALVSKDITLCSH